MLDFEEKEKASGEVPGEKPRRKNENEQQTIKAEAESKLSHVGGKLMLSPLFHPSRLKCVDQMEQCKSFVISFMGLKLDTPFKLVHIVKRPFCRTDRFQNWVNCAKIM